jgi:NitT/TauT family transport system substrate-binding protein
MLSPAGADSARRLAVRRKEAIMNNRHMLTRAIAPTAVAAVLALALSGCGNSSASDSGQSGDGTYTGTVSIAHSSWLGFAPLDLAVKKGFFEKHGAKVKIEDIESKSDSKSALAAGRIQGIATSLDTVVLSSAAGIDSQVVLALDTSDGGDGLIAKKDIKSFKDLKGKSIALDTTGGASFFWFNYVAQKEGMSMKDFNVQSMSSGDAGSAFVAGKVDAAMTWQPWLDKAASTSFGKVLLSSSDYKGVIVDALCLDTKFVHKYPKTVQAIVDGWDDSLKYMKSNPDDAYTILNKVLGSDDVNATKKEYQTEIQLWDKAANKKYFGQDGKGDAYKIANYAAQLWVDTKMADTKADVSKILNPQFVQG